MTSRNDLLKRVEIIMKVQLGQMSATDAAKGLGITRRHYYRLEKDFLKNSLDSVSPQKRGPKIKQTDPKTKQIEDELQKTRRERELLEIKLKEMEYLNGKMREALNNKEKQRGKKSGSRDGCVRPQILKGIQTANSGFKNGSKSEGKNNNETV